MGCTCSGERELEDADEAGDKYIMEMIKKHIKENEVMIYTISSDAKCIQAKEILKGFGVEYEYFDIDKLGIYKKMHKSLQVLTGTKAFPYYFHKGVYAGGMKDIEAKYFKEIISE